MSELVNDVLSSPLPWIVALVGVGIWVGKVNERTSAVSNVMIEIRNELRTILQKVEQVLLRVDVGVARGSPLQLTDVGRSMSETLGSTAWAEAKALDLFEQVRGMGPYDVQEFSSWQALYIGETGSLKDRVGPHHEHWDCAKRHGMTHIHAHVSVSSEIIRRREEADLVEQYHPACNR